MQQVKFQKFANNPKFQNVGIITVGNLYNLAQQASINLSLPAFSCPSLTFKAKKVSYTSENDYYWYGTIESNDDAACTDGSITLMAKDGRKFGSATVDGVQYDYQDISGGKQVIYKVNTSLSNENECYTTPTTPIITPPNPERVEPCQQPVNNVVRVLVLWTLAAQNAEANINDRVALAIAQTNQIYGNSQIANLTLQLSGSQLLNNFVETNNDIALDVNTLSNRPDVQQLRANTQSDIVILLTNGDYGNTNGRVLDIGPNAARAYGISQTTMATSSRLTFAHEVAHLFGCRHDDDPTGTIEHGYTFRTGFIFTKKRYTLMALMPGGESREMLFSNPNIKVKNKSTGTACCNNNAQQHRNTSAVVAGFVPNPGPVFNVSLEEYNTSPDCVPQQYEAVVRCGTAPYTYQWAVSTNGIDYALQSNTTDILLLENWCTGAPTSLFLRLIVTDANGLTRTIDRTYISFGMQSSALLQNEPEPILQKPESSKLIASIAPNPVTSNSKIVLQAHEAGNCYISLYDAKGQLVKIIYNSDVVKGTISIPLQTNNLLNGLYRVRVRINNKTESRSFVVSK